MAVSVLNRFLDQYRLKSTNNDNMKALNQDEGMDKVEYQKHMFINIEIFSFSSPRLVA